MTVMILTYMKFPSFTKINHLCHSMSTRPDLSAKKGQKATKQL